MPAAPRRRRGRLTLNEAALPSQDLALGSRSCSCLKQSDFLPSSETTMLMPARCPRKGHAKFPSLLWMEGEAERATGATLQLFCPPHFCGSRPSTPPVILAYRRPGALAITAMLDAQRFPQYPAGKAPAGLACGLLPEEKALEP